MQSCTILYYWQHVSHSDTSTFNPFHIHNRPCNLHLSWVEEDNRYCKAILVSDDKQDQYHTLHVQRMKSLAVFLYRYPKYSFFSNTKNYERKNDLLLDYFYIFHCLHKRLLFFSYKAKKDFCLSSWRLPVALNLPKQAQGFSLGIFYVVMYNRYRISFQ